MIGRNRGLGVGMGLSAWLLIALAPPLRAQEPPPPTGPAQIIGGAARARASRELEQAAQRGTPPAAADSPAPSVNGHAEPAESRPTAPAAAAPAPAASPHGAMPSDHGAAPGEGEPPPIASEKADPSLPDGTVQVRVIDPQGRPAANAAVSLGIMLADGGRSAKDGKAGADGIATFTQLPAGEKQAYRVNVPYQGAKYSSNPFRLPPRGGYRVEIRQLPVTHDSRLVVMYPGATSIELKDDRIKIVQQVRLLNVGSATYVLPEAGTLVRFPKGFMAVQTENVMTDQHVTESKDEGVRVRGSVPPGEVTLLWGFDLPLEGSEAHFTIGLPWFAFAYRVISDAPPGMTLEVAGLPDPQRIDEEGRHMLWTETRLKIGDPPLKELNVTLRGIPGAGPARWIAAACALALLIGGAVFAGKPNARTSRDTQRLRADEIAARKEELLARARELQAQRAAEEIGPQYHAEQLQLVRDELAALLLAASQGTAARS